MNLALTRFGPQPGVEIAPAAYSQKQLVISNAQQLTSISRMSLEFAVDCIRDIKALKKEIEASRIAIKAPVLTLGRDIDAAAAHFCADLDTEDKRLTGLVSKYQDEQRRIAAEAERERQRELNRIEDERLAAEREAKRILAEEARKARSLEEVEKAALRLQAQQAQASESAAVARAAVVAAPVVVAPSVEGMSTRRIPKFDLIDARALAFGRPDLVRIEPNAQAINKEILAGNLTLPGLECWIETGVRV